MEKLIGSVSFTPITHLLSFHIQEMNAKSRNVGTDPQPPEPAKVPGLYPLNIPDPSCCRDGRYQLCIRLLPDYSICG